jgi:hypothetical protein
VLVPRGGFEQRSVDAYVRVLGQVGWELRPPDQLQVVGGQAQMAHSGRIQISGAVQYQHRNMVDAVSGGVFPKMQDAGERLRERLQPEAVSIADDAAREHGT